MSNNPKCPVCQKGVIMFKDNQSCECSQCRFQCGREHLDQVAAAMALTMAMVELQTKHAGFLAVQKAVDRVIEVFNV